MLCEYVRSRPGVLAASNLQNDAMKQITIIPFAAYNNKKQKQTSSTVLAAAVAAKITVVSPLYYKCSTITLNPHVPTTYAY